MDKEQLLNNINGIISEKIQNFEQLISDARTSNNDTKSSMGDKYETGREMLQQEINNLQRQLNEVLILQAEIKKITAEASDKVQNGALVKTDKGLFYISVSLGKLYLDELCIMTVSKDSPIVKAMINKKMGDRFVINESHHIIQHIW